MKILISCYSRTGNTKKLRDKIAKILKADVDEIIDKKDRSGIKGWFGGGKDVLFKKETEISFKKDVSKYDLVVIGTPVWVGTMVPAVKRYLKDNKFKKVAFFCTFGGSASKTFADMEKSSKKPISVLGLKDKTVENSSEDIGNFCKKIIS